MTKQSVSWNTEYPLADESYQVDTYHAVHSNRWAFYMKVPPDLTGPPGVKVDMETVDAMVILSPAGWSWHAGLRGEQAMVSGLCGSSRDAQRSCEAVLLYWTTKQIQAYEGF